MKIQKQQQKNQPKIIQQSIISSIKERLNMNNIFRQFQLITNMTRHLQIKFKVFSRLEPLRNLNHQQILQIIKTIPWLNYNQIRKGDKEEQIVKIIYQNSHRVLLVTGITRQAIQDMLRIFPNTHFSMKNLSSCKIIGNNGFWVSIQANSEETASHLKKFLRNKKRERDEVSNQSNSSYKLEGRRIRIVILKEDFLSILIDAMTEIKSELFYRQFQLASPPCDRRRSLEETITNADSKKKTLFYKAALVSSYASKTETKEQELSDGFSETNSLSSDILDSNKNKIRDLIETSQQGIQSQCNDDPNLNPNLDSNSKIQPQPLSIQPQPTATQITAQIIQKVNNINPIINEHIQINQQTVSPIKKQNINHQIHRRLQQEKQKQSDNPFIENIMFSNTQEDFSPTASIQTQSTLTNIPYALMKRLFQEYKNTKNTSQLIELAEWMRSQSEQQRNRHRFFDSLCRPKIIQKRSPFE